jgi:hypothetical protein
MERRGWRLLSARRCALSFIFYRKTAILHSCFSRERRDWCPLGFYILLAPACSTCMFSPGCPHPSTTGVQGRSQAQYNAGRYCIGELGPSGRGASLSPTCSPSPSPTSAELILSNIPRAVRDAKPQAPRRTTSFGPADVFVGIICARTRHRRSLVANGFG